MPARMFCFLRRHHKKHQVAVLRDGEERRQANRHPENVTGVTECSQGAATVVDPPEASPPKKKASWWKRLWEKIRPKKKSKGKDSTQKDMVISDGLVIPEDTIGESEGEEKPRDCETVIVEKAKEDSASEKELLGSAAKDHYEEEEDSSEDFSLHIGETEDSRDKNVSLEHVIPIAKTVETEAEEEPRDCETVIIEKAKEDSASEKELLGSAAKDHYEEEEDSSEDFSLHIGETEDSRDKNVSLEHVIPIEKTVETEAEEEPRDCETVIIEKAKEDSASEKELLGSAAKDHYEEEEDSSEDFSLHIGATEDSRDKNVSLEHVIPIAKTVEAEAEEEPRDCEVLIEKAKEDSASAKELLGSAAKDHYEEEEDSSEDFSLHIGEIEDSRDKNVSLEHVIPIAKTVETEAAEEPRDCEVKAREDSDRDKELVNYFEIPNVEWLSSEDKDYLWELHLILSDGTDKPESEAEPRDGLVILNTEKDRYEEEDDVSEDFPLHIGESEDSRDKNDLLEHVVIPIVKTVEAEAEEEPRDCEVVIEKAREDSDREKELLKHFEIQNVEQLSSEDKDYLWELHLILSDGEDKPESEAEPRDGLLVLNAEKDSNEEEDDVSEDFSAHIGETEDSRDENDFLEQAVNPIAGIVKTEGEEEPRDDVAILDMAKDILDSEEDIWQDVEIPAMEMEDTEDEIKLDDSTFHSAEEANDTSEDKPWEVSDIDSENSKGDELIESSTTTVTNSTDSGSTESERVFHHPHLLPSGRLRKRSIDEETFLTEEITCLGFPNLAQTCYMNSTLQGLLTLTPFVQDVFNQEHVWRYHPDSDLFRGFMDVSLCQRFDNETKMEVLATFKDMVADYYMEFEDDTQKDAQEFLSCFLNMVMSLSSKLQSIAMDIDCSYTCPVKAHIGFSMLSTRTCKGCGSRSSTEEDFLNLSLDLGRGGSVNSCLHNYLNEIQLECNCKCGSQVSTQKYSFLTMPNYLILQLQRFRFIESYSLEKVHTPIGISQELLVNTETCANERALTRYSLVSVVSHLGPSAEYGHYICDGKKLLQGSNSWLTFNDSDVSNTTVKAVCNSRRRSAYLLFYEKQVENLPRI